MANDVAESSSPHKWWVLFGVGLGVLMSTLDGSIVNIALPTLARELNTPFGNVQWVVLSYLLVITSLTLGVARLGDMHGKKGIYTAGLVIFTVGSVLCGVAQSIGWLIGFRALQGLGAVMVQALGTAIVTEAFPASERGRAIGITGSTVSVGIALGPSLGGVLIEVASWRSIFLVNVPIGILAIAVALRFLPRSAPRLRDQRFDVAGALIMMVTLVCYALGMTLIEQQSIGSTTVISLLVAAVVGIVLFFAVETRIDQPMIDLRMFRNELFSINLLTGVLTFLAISGNLLILPFYLELVRGYSTIQAGLLLAVIPIATAVIAPISGSLSDRFGPRPVTVAGLLIMVLGYVSLLSLRGDTSVIGYLLRVGLVSVGGGVFQAPNNSAVMGAVPPERLGIASGLLTLSRTLGQTTGLPLMGALFAGQVLAVSGADVNTAPPSALESGMHIAFSVSLSIMVVALVLSTYGWWRSKHNIAPQPIRV